MGLPPSSEVILTTGIYGKGKAAPHPLPPFYASGMALRIPSGQPHKGERWGMPSCAVGGLSSAVSTKVLLSMPRSKTLGASGNVV